MFGIEKLKERVKYLEERDEDTLKVVNAFFGYDGICFPRFKSQGDALCYAFDAIRKQIDDCRPKTQPDYCSMINRLEKRIEQQEEIINELKEAVEFLIKDKAKEEVSRISQDFENMFKDILEARENIKRRKSENKPKNKTNKKGNRKNA